MTYEIQKGFASVVETIAYENTSGEMVEAKVHSFLFTRTGSAPVERRMAFARDCVHGPTFFIVGDWNPTQRELENLARLFKMVEAKPEHVRVIGTIG